MSVAGRESRAASRAAETLQWTRRTKGRGSSISREVTEVGRLFVLLRQTAVDTVESHCERTEARKHGNSAVYIGFLNKRQSGGFITALLHLTEAAADTVVERIFEPPGFITHPSTKHFKKYIYICIHIQPCSPWQP